MMPVVTVEASFISFKASSSFILRVCYFWSRFFVWVEHKMDEQLHSSQNPRLIYMRYYCTREGSLTLFFDIPCGLLTLSRLKSEKKIFYGKIWRNKQHYSLIMLPVHENYLYRYAARLERGLHCTSAHGLRRKETYFVTVTKWNPCCHKLRVNLIPASVN